MTKSKWKKLDKTKIEEKANEIYKNECEKLKKLKCLNQYKAKIKRERYMDILQQKQARIYLKWELELLVLELILKTNMKTLCDQDARKRLMMKNIYLQNLKN